MKRIRLTNAEISAILGIAGDADAPSTVECCETPEEGERVLEAFESGMEKLRHMLANRTAS